MRALLQRVQSASVSVEEKIVGNIASGLVIFLGIRQGDTSEDTLFLADKCTNLRIFGDKRGKFNLSAIDIGASILVVSQFTLYGDCRKGRRPNFMEAAPPNEAEPLYCLFISRIRHLGLITESGLFGAKMLVNIQNDGPVTILVESKSTSCDNSKTLINPSSNPP